MFAVTLHTKISRLTPCRTWFWVVMVAVFIINILTLKLLFIMSEKDIPFGYASCYATDAQCSKAANCLRRRVAELKKMQNEMPTTDLCISPAYVERIEKGQTCSEYRSIDLQKYARGMSRLFDNVTKRLYPDVRERVIEVFSSRRSFYYALRGDVPISPEEQVKIAAVFDEYGYSAPQFDSFEMLHNWD
ncbi:DUF6078 family protein [Prevotella aurantiaca]|nr:DUF6078 family protein [Prevotella aurantiaca]